MRHTFAASVSAGLFLLSSVIPAAGEGFNDAPGGDTLIIARHSHHSQAPHNYPVDHNPAWRPGLVAPHGGGGSGESSSVSGGWNGGGSSAGITPACGAHRDPSGFCYPGKGRICLDGTTDSSHPCEFSDLRLPEDIVLDPDPRNRGWIYLMDRRTGWSRPAGTPRINFAGRYYIFKYSLGTMSADWTMIDLKTGKFSNAPSVFSYGYEGSEPFRVTDSKGVVHECRYAVDLEPDPLKPLVKAVVSLMGSDSEIFDDPENSPCSWNRCYSRRFIMRDGEFVPESRDDGGYRPSECPEAPGLQ